MALPICQFVDRVGTGAVQRLNLNDGQNFSLLQGPDVRPGPDLSPPKLKRAVVNTLLVDGASIPATAYDNRIIRLPLRVTACDEEEMAEILETLHRELDRAKNVLKWHPTYNFRPVYFRTFRSPDYRLDQKMEGRAELIVTLSLVAEPFAYGDREDLGPFTITNDPAAGVNPQYVDITGIVGDIPTPIYCYAASGVVASNMELLAVRRHGTPGDMVWSYQAEAMNQILDTAVQPNDATASGAGANYSQTSFATATLQTRLNASVPVPGGDDADWRGIYRVFVRVRRIGGGTDPFGIQLRYTAGAPPEISNALVSYVGINGFWDLLDLGLMPIPLGSDPITDGYSNIELSVGQILLELRAQRPAGAAVLDWDYVLLVPADEELSLLAFGASGDAGSNNDRRVVDGPNDIIYRLDAAGAFVRSTAPGSSFIGKIPLLTPDQTNRLFLLPWVSTLGGDLITITNALTVRYWPRYLYVR